MGKPKEKITAVAPSNAETLLELSANIDDMTGEVLALLPGICLEAGALDAWLTPVLMKKGRPAHILGALCEQGAYQAVELAIFKNSTTLGVRRTEVRRTAAARRMETVQTPWGEVGVKVAELYGEVINAAPEFEDCLKCSKSSGVPFKEVWAEALALWKKGL